MIDPRKETDCDPITIPGKFEAPGPVRPVIPCDPPIIPEEKEFQSPAAQPPIAVTAAGYPDPIPYRNVEQRKTCAEDWPANDPELPPATGADGVSEAGEIQELFYFQNTGVLTSAELNFTAVQMAGPRRDSILTALLGDPHTLAGFLNISVAKAEALVAAAQAVQDRVNEQAEALALARLDCGWDNEEQVVTCEPSVVGSGEPSPADESNPVNYDTGETGNPVTVSATTTFGCNSFAKSIKSKNNVSNTCNS